MYWLIYWPLLLVVAAAIAAGLAVLIRKFRHRNDNPFIVPPPEETENGVDHPTMDKRSKDRDV